MTTYGAISMPTFGPIINSHDLSKMLTDHTSAIADADYDGKNENGYGLLEDVATRDPYELGTLADKQLRKHRDGVTKHSFQVLGQRILLLGANFLFHHGLLNPFRLSLNWEDDRDRYIFRFDKDEGGLSLNGFALFDAWQNNDQTLDDLLGAISRLQIADIRLGVVNIAGQRSEKVLDLAEAHLTRIHASGSPVLGAGDYVLFVGVHTEKGWLFQL